MLTELHGATKTHRRHSEVREQQRGVAMCLWALRRFPVSVGPTGTFHSGSESADTLGLSTGVRSSEADLMTTAARCHNMSDGH